MSRPLRAGWKEPVSPRTTGQHPLPRSRPGRPQFDLDRCPPSPSGNSTGQNFVDAATVEIDHLETPALAVKIVAILLTTPFMRYLALVDARMAATSLDRASPPLSEA